MSTREFKTDFDEVNPNSRGYYGCCGAVTPAMLKEPELQLHTIITPMKEYEFAENVKQCREENNKKPIVYISPVYGNANYLLSIMKNNEE